MLFSIFYSLFNVGSEMLLSVFWAMTVHVFSQVLTSVRLHQQYVVEGNVFLRRMVTLVTARQDLGLVHWRPTVLVSKNMSESEIFWSKNCNFLWKMASSVLWEHLAWKVHDDFFYFLLHNFLQALITALKNMALKKPVVLLYFQSVQKYRPFQAELATWM